MNKITVTVDALREKLEANRAGHRESFLRGLVGYRKTLLGELERRKKQIDHHIKHLQDGEQVGRVEIQAINILIPEDHTGEYDTALAMLDMCIETELEITTADFNQFVMDDWGWRERFLSNTVAYHGIDAQAELAALQIAKSEGRL